MLITSRREEPWLDCNYKRLTLSGLSGQDVEELAAKILQRVGVDRGELPPEYLDLLKLLGGHPLSLRVILPHLKTQSPIEIMEALRLGLDTFQGAEEEGRDKSLYVSLDYSFAKLSDRARQDLPFLALFSERVIAGWLVGFSQSSDNDFGKAYQDIFEENLQEPDWLRILNEAAEVGILEHSDKTLYKIHPALPWYLRRRLAKSHPKAWIGELEKNLLLFYAVLANECHKQLISQTEVATFFLQIEEPNLLQNLRLAEQQHDWSNAALILQALGEVYERLGRELEFKSLRQRALNQLGTHLADVKTKGRDALNFWLYLRSVDARRAIAAADWDTASAIYQEFLEELIALNDPSVNDNIAVAYHQLGVIAQEKREFDQSIAYYQKALQIFENVGDLDKAAKSYHELGMIALQQRRFDEALAYSQKALQIKENVGDLYNAASDYHQLGIVAMEQRQFDKATAYYQKALKIYKNGGDFYRAANEYHNLGIVAQEQRRFEQAIAYYQESLKIYEDAGNFYKAANDYHQLGSVAEEQRQFEEAIAYYQKALKIYEEAEDFYKASHSCYKLGKIANKQGNFDSAIAYFQKAFSGIIAANEWRGASSTLARWGETLEAQKNWNDAIKIYIQALEINLKHNQEWIGWNLRKLGWMLKAVGESQFQAVSREVTGEECPKEWLSLIRAASEAQEE